MAIQNAEDVKEELLSLVSWDAPYEPNFAEATKTGVKKVVKECSKNEELKRAFVIGGVKAIPSFKDAENEQSDVTGTLLHHVLNKCKRSDHLKKEFITASSEVFSTSSNPFRKLLFISRYFSESSENCKTTFVEGFSKALPNLMKIEQAYWNYGGTVALNNPLCDIVPSMLLVFSRGNDKLLKISVPKIIETMVPPCMNGNRGGDLDVLFDEIFTALDTDKLDFKGAFGTVGNDVYGVSPYSESTRFAFVSRKSGNAVPRFLSVGYTGLISERDDLRKPPKEMTGYLSVSVPLVGGMLPREIDVSNLGPFFEDARKVFASKDAQDNLKPLANVIMKDRGKLLACESLK